MNLTEFIKGELKSFGKIERVVFPCIVIFIIIISIIMRDNKIALISAICGISYTILAGKGKISCYFIGITGTICYSYLAYKNGFYGNLALYSLYYLPMEIIGIFKWKKHLNKDTQEISKTKLSKKQAVVYYTVTIVIMLITSFVLNITGDKSPIMDSFCTVFSILGQLLTVKRCIEQWYIWLIVNIVSAIMWIIAYINGSNCMATVIMWLIYVVLAVYFLSKWKKELKQTAI